MTYRAPERTPRRTPDYRVHVVPNHRARVACGLAVAAAIAVALGLQSPASPTSQASSPVEASRDERPRGLGEAGAFGPEGHGTDGERGRAPSEPGSGGRGMLGPADGAIPDGTSAFDDEVAGVAQLDDALLDALRAATTAAADRGVRLVVTSGWRSPEYQQHLLDEAVAKYGSEAEAARWVASPERSEHVSGDAVDVGPSAAAEWLSRHGAAYGLCRIYGNEPWHFELRPDAADHGCPETYADPTHDPRLHS